MFLSNTCLPLLASATLVACYPPGQHWPEPAGHHWQAPKHSDLRSPCPALNALANHGYLPRSGRNVPRDTFVAGILEVLNFNANFTNTIVNDYMPFSTTGIHDTLHLSDLDHHNTSVAEFDGSLSRGDIYSGDNHSFNVTLWNMVSRHFNGYERIPLSVAGKARVEQVLYKKSINPEFDYRMSASLGTTTLYMTAMKGDDKGDTRRDFVEILFREERIPFKEGYKVSSVTHSFQDLGVNAAEINSTAPDPLA